MLCCTSDYVMTCGMPSLKAMTVCLWMKTADTENEGTPLSYAVSGSTNEVVLFNYRNFTLWLGNGRRYKPATFLFKSSFCTEFKVNAVL